MATLDSLKILLFKLDRAKKAKSKVQLTITNKHVKRFIERLESEKILQIVSNNENEITVVVRQEVTTFQTLPKPVNVKRNQILVWVKKLMPTITGHLILTTRHGIMTHHEAIVNGLGGQIIGFVY